MRRSDVDKMDAEAVDRGLELRKLIQPRLAPAPVVFLQPVRRDLLRIAEGQPLRPVIDAFTLRLSRRPQAPLEILELVIFYLDAKGRDLVAHRRVCSCHVSSDR
jgi:hypothetical protein